MAKKMTTKTVIGEKPEMKILSGLVTILGTSKSKYLKKDVEYEVSPLLAERLVKTGHATLK